MKPAREYRHHYGRSFLQQLEYDTYCFRRNVLCILATVATFIAAAALGVVLWTLI